MPVHQCATVVLRRAECAAIGDTWCTSHMGQLAPLSQSFALATGHTRSTSTPCKLDTQDGAIVRMEVSSADGGGQGPGGRAAEECPLNNYTKVIVRTHLIGNSFRGGDKVCTHVPLNNQPYREKKKTLYHAVFRRLARTYSERF